MKTIPAKITERLDLEAEELIKEGWYANKSELVRDAIRDLVARKRLQRLEKAIREDVEWGLHGRSM